MKHLKQDYESLLTESTRKVENVMASERLVATEEQVRRLRSENSQLITDKLDLQSKFDALHAAKINVETKMDEIRGYYEAEVTSLKIQIKNNGMKMSKSRFCSTSNLNIQPVSAQTKTNTPQTQEASQKASQPSVKIESSLKKDGSATGREQGSYIKKNWDELKSMIHEKDDSRSLKRMDSQQSIHSASSPHKPKLSLAVKSNSDSSNSNVENEIPSRSSSTEEKSKKTNKLKSRPKPVRHKSMMPSSTKPNPPSSEVSPPKASPLKSNQSKIAPVKLELVESPPPPDNTPSLQPQRSTTPKAKTPIDYKVKFELAQSKYEEICLDKQLYEDRLIKKDKQNRILKKQCETLKNDISSKKQDKQNAMDLLVAKEKELIIALNVIDEFKSGKIGTEAEVIKLRDTVQKQESKINDLEEELTVFININF